MTRKTAISFVIMIVVILALLIATAPAHSYSCSDVRQAYRSYGAAQLWRWARQYRVSAGQIRQAVACIRGRR